MQEKVIVLGAKNMDFTASDGKAVRMVKIFYVGQYSEDSNERRGLLPMETSAPLSTYQILGSLPAMATVELAQRPGRGNKPEIQIVAVHSAVPYALWPQVDAEEVLLGKGK